MPKNLYMMWEKNRIVDTERNHIIEQWFSIGVP